MPWARQTERYRAEVVPRPRHSCRSSLRSTPLQRPCFFQRSLPFFRSFPRDRELVHESWTLGVFGMPSCCRQSGIEARPHEYESGNPNPVASGPWHGLCVKLFTRSNPTAWCALCNRLADVISDTLAQQRFRTMLVGAFSSMALILAAIGLYGVMALHGRAPRS